MSFTQESWARDLLTRLGYPVEPNNLTTVLAWEYQEGGHFANDARFNPLNTTYDHAKYHAINGDGVASYPDYETGMRATIATLRLPAYATVRSDLAADRSPQRTTAAIAASPWGTWHGSSPGPVVARARHTVHAHPSWTKHKHSPAPKPASGGTNGKVVLDLQELHRLGDVYRDASSQVLQERRAVQDIGADLEAARAALPDPALANAISASFAYLTDPQLGLDGDARLLDELSAYLGEVRTLAEQADADGNHKWTKKERLAFAKRHAGAASDPAMRAVLEALDSGTIYRRPSDVQPAGEQKIAAVLDLAAKQHVHETGVNMTKYGAWFGDNGQEWCAVFVSWVFAHAGSPLPHIQGPHGFAYVPYAISYAREHGQLHDTPKAGDIMLLKDGSHTGIVSKVHGDGSFDTIEGNEGDQVSHGHRLVSSGTYYFWRPIT